MAFDLSTAKPAGFDMSTARPVDDQAPTDVSGISEEALKVLQSARSKKPFDQRVTDFRANIEQGMHEHEAANRAAFSESLGEGLAEAAKFVSGIPGLVPAAASSVVLEPVAGIAGVAQSVNPFADPGAGAEAVEAVRGLAIPPLGEAAKETAQDIGEFLEPVGEALKVPGEATLEATGSPLAAAAVETAIVGIPEVLAARVGAKGAGKAVATRKEKVRLKNFEKVQEIINNPQSAANVEFRVVSGRKRPDKLAKQALKQGFTAPVVAFSKGAQKADRIKFVKMLEIKRKGMDDLEFGSKNRATDIVGDSIAARVNHLLKVNQSAGKRIDQVARTLKGRAINLDQAKQKFISKLQDEGVTVDDNLVASYQGSSFAGLDAPQKAINQMLERLGRLGDESDALQAHRAKRFIDENITLGGKAGEGLKGRSQGIVLSLRKDIDDALDSKFRNYKRVNDAYSKTIGALNDFQDAAGSRIDVTGKNADRAIGTLSRRLLSNVQSRVQLSDSLDNLEDIATQTGAKFDDDIVSQAIFADVLDSAFGSSAQRSLAGEVGKAVTGPQVIRAAESPLTATLEATFGKIQAIRGINQEKAFKVMKQLLSR